MSKVYILYLVYGEKFDNKEITVLCEICSKLFPAKEQIKITIDNSIESNFISINKNCIKISGDNTAFEFSGWDAGYKFLMTNFKVNDDDFILYANDTFHQRSYADGGSSYINFFDAKFYDFENWDMRESAIGYLDDFPKKVSLMGINYRHWIRSNLFLLSSKVSKKLHPLTFPSKKEYLFGGHGEPFFRPNDQISKNWMAYICVWLFGDQNMQYPEYKLNWIKCTPLNEHNRKFFQVKCIAILSEHFLSARLHLLGVKIFDTNLFLKRKDRHLTNYYRDDTQNTNV